jgi:hypothetical protein
VYQEKGRLVYFAEASEPSLGNAMVVRTNIPDVASTLNKLDVSQTMYPSTCRNVGRLALGRIFNLSKLAEA